MEIRESQMEARRVGPKRESWGTSKRNMRPELDWRSENGEYTVEARRVGPKRESWGT